MVDLVVCKKRPTTNELLADNEIMRKRLGIMFHFKKLKNRSCWKILMMPV